MFKVERATLRDIDGFPMYVAEVTTRYPFITFYGRTEAEVDLKVAQYRIKVRAADRHFAKAGRR